MTILHSCCCWRSVRKGSIACGIYTAIYCSVNAAHSSCLLHEEILFLNNITNGSNIDPDITTNTSAVLAALILAFSACGIITTFLLLYGIYKDIKYFLIPWIFNMCFFTIVDVIYLSYGLIVHALEWNPFVAILITVDFFLNTLNLYAILCVISQYQEYKAGRGRAIDDDMIRVPNFQYSTTQPTATSYLSSQQQPKKSIGNQDKLTPLHSPTVTATNLLEPPPSLSQMNRGPRKSVKFEDSSEMTTLPPSSWLVVNNKNGDAKNGSGGGSVDTIPLIDKSSNRGNERRLSQKGAGGGDGETTDI